jgi:hypothetical protein
MTLFNSKMYVYYLYTILMILTIKLCLTMYLAVGQNNGQIDDQLPKQTTKHFTCEKSGHLNIWLVMDYGVKFYLVRF